MQFKNFKQAVAKQFARMQQQYPLFRTDVSGDELWQLYLTSFPEGTNPIFRERTEHDCSCCRSFIRTIGNVVAITDHGLETIWDGAIPAEEKAYYAVAVTLGRRVASAPIVDFFFHYEKTVGTDKNFEDMLGSVKTWEHFHVQLPTQFVVAKHLIPTKLGELRAKHDVFKRGLDTLTHDALDTVLELIAQKSLYRGAEFKGIVQNFKSCKLAYGALPEQQRDHYAWLNCNLIGPAVASIRNSAIGTLLVDLSEGVDLERAVKAFEAKVAPANYKRPTALVTPRMIEEAKKQVESLGLTSALERRYAVLEDITINNVLFANRSTRTALGGNVFDALAGETAVKPNAFDKVEEVPIEKFLTEVLPTAKRLEVLVENDHIGRFVSLIAPVDPTAPGLFKWSNGFSWTYTGDVTDSIKERVKAAGGNVTGELCCRLAWEYPDDLDFYMIEPGGGRIYFGTRRQRSSNGGMLDVDANGADGLREHPVENIFYERVSTMRPGTYQLKVNNYSRRSDGAGFEVEIDYRGEVTRLVYEKVVRMHDCVDVAEIKVDKNKQVTIIPRLPSATRSKEVWGVKTRTFVDVDAVMLSPNYWDEQGVGNKHWFFMLNGCRNDGTARGFYNEFLKPEMDAHRKVMEMVGTKMKTDTSDRQLSGLGFSSTQRASLVCRVTGSFSRVIRVIF